MLLVLVALIAASALTSAWHYWMDHRERRRAAEARCSHRWVYHSLYREGRMWNRICSFCRKHEARWSDTPHPNWPPPGARIRRDESMPDEEWRRLRDEVKALLDKGSK